jgi:hypothetical protein
MKYIRMSRRSDANPLSLAIALWRGERASVRHRDQLHLEIRYNIPAFRLSPLQSYTSYTMSKIEKAIQRQQEKSVSLVPLLHLSNILISELQKANTTRRTSNFA